jgi:hypothetical protein
MVVARNVLARRRIGDERAQREAVDERVARRQSNRVLVRHVDVREVERLARRGDLELRLADACHDRQVVLEAARARRELEQVGPRDAHGIRSRSQGMTTSIRRSTSGVSRSPKSGSK